jgi:hypothetical protein
LATLSGSQAAAHRFRSGTVIVSVTLGEIVSDLETAAATLRITLTAHDVALARAHDRAGRVDQLLAQLKDAGVLKDFNIGGEQRATAF